MFSCEQSKVGGVYLLTRQKVFKVMRVSVTPILAAKQAICLISTDNWLQFPSFISGHTDVLFIKFNIKNGGREHYLT